MAALAIILVVFGVILFIFTYLNRKDKAVESEVYKTDSECCGAHIVCERESLLNSTMEIVYYDDENLDSLSNIDSEKYTDEQINQLSEVFYTLEESDMAGWLRSLQMRNIQLPQELKDAALMIMRERRGITTRKR